VPGRPLFQRRAPVGLVGLSLLVVAVAGCSAQINDPSSPYFPKAAAAESSPPLPLTALLHSGPMNTAIGPVSRPTLALTPGVVATTDATTVCAGPTRVTYSIPVSEQAAVFAAYAIPFPQVTTKYALDYLIPPTLGGAPVERNLWPASTRPIGFHEKQQLDSRLRTLVCDGVLPLTQVQQELASDWYSLWLRYGG
jgi:hypothetical protein